MSNAAKAREMFKTRKFEKNTDFVNALVSDLGMSKPTARTYAHNIRREFEGKGKTVVARRKGSNLPAVINHDALIRENQRASKNEADMNVIMDRIAQSFAHRILKIMADTIGSGQKFVLPPHQPMARRGRPVTIKENQTLPETEKKSDGPRVLRRPSAGETAAAA